MRSQFVSPILAIGGMLATVAIVMAVAQPAAAMPPQGLAPTALPDTYLGGIQRVDEVSNSRAGNTLPDTYLALRDVAVDAGSSQRMMPDTFMSHARNQAGADTAHRIMPDTFLTQKALE